MFVLLLFHLVSALRQQQQPLIPPLSFVEHFGSSTSQQISQLSVGHECLVGDKSNPIVSFTYTDKVSLKFDDQVEHNIHPQELESRIESIGNKIEPKYLKELLACKYFIKNNIPPMPHVCEAKEGNDVVFRATYTSPEEDIFVAYGESGGEETQAVAIGRIHVHGLALSLDDDETECLYFSKECAEEVKACIKQIKDMPKPRTPLRVIIYFVARPTSCCRKQHRASEACQLTLDTLQTAFHAELATVVRDVEEQGVDEDVVKLVVWPEWTWRAVPGKLTSGDRDEINHFIHDTMLEQKLKNYWIIPGSIFYGFEVEQAYKATERECGMNAPVAFIRGDWAMFNAVYLFHANKEGVITSLLPHFKAKEADELADNEKWGRCWIASGREYDNIQSFGPQKIEIAPGHKLQLDICLDHEGSFDHDFDNMVFNEKLSIQMVLSNGMRLSRANNKARRADNENEVELLKDVYPQMPHHTGEHNNHVPLDPFLYIEDGGFVALCDGDKIQPDLRKIVNGDRASKMGNLLKTLAKHDQEHETLEDGEKYTDFLRKTLDEQQRRSKKGLKGHYDQEKQSLDIVARLQSVYQADRNKISNIEQEKLQKLLTEFQGEEHSISRSSILTIV